ncbi:MAG: 3-dehydroquinate synthase [Pyrinomonadaceae bacterium]
MQTKRQIVDVRLAAQPRRYRVHIGRDLLDNVGDQTRECLGPQSSRVAIISNQTVFDLYGARVVKSLEASDFLVASWLMGDGERFKSLVTLQKALQFLSSAGLERADSVIALGGGVVGDLAGFAAAIYLRGIPLIQVPTTVIAQIDSAVGGKTAVNLRAGKNLVGAFHQPRTVIADVETIKTLPARELVSGWCEAIKNGAVGSRDLFDQTVMFLSTLKSGTAAHSARALPALIKAHCTFKAEIVRHDEREDAKRTDNRSRRVLNFGHTIGHALEALTRYRRFRHGEAVGHGMLVAGEISKNLGLLAASELTLLREAVRMCGPLPPAADLAPREIMDLVRTDKKIVGGEVQWVLLKGIGKPRIVAGKEIPSPLIRDALIRGLGTIA